MRAEEELRPLVWKMMGQLEMHGLGVRRHVSDQRDRFDLAEGTRWNLKLCERPEAQGFIRADRSSLLFRRASAELRSSLPADLIARSSVSSKGLEFRWTQLVPQDIDIMFEALVRLATSDSSAGQLDLNDSIPPAATPDVAAELAPVPTSELTFEFNQGDVDITKPLIYLWEVEASSGEVVFRYVGKAKNGPGRPIEQYRRNVRNLLRGRGYRKGKPDGYREVHRRLADAMKSGEKVRLSFVCNVQEGEDINEVERHWQRKFRC